MQFVGIVGLMESKMPQKIHKLTALMLGVILLLLALPASAETYRWKDKDGKVNYGTSVPAEYADTPYDVLNNSGLVIRHVEDSREPLEEVVKEVIKEKAPLISDSDRQRQSDRLLVLKYQSEDDITKALELEIDQLGYDSRLINKSLESTSTAIRDEVRQAGDQQRAGVPIPDELNKKLNRLYNRLSSEEKKLASLERREQRIRGRFMKELESYQRLEIEAAQELEEINAPEPDQG
jgi:hypothetical protein